MVKILIGNVTTRIIGHLPEEVHKALDAKLSYTPTNAKHIKSVKEGRWDGRYVLYKKNFGQSFDTGLTSMVTDILGEHQIAYQKDDARERPEVNLPNLKFTPMDGYEEREYQQFTIDRAIQRTRGILKIATGGGKTLVVNELISKIKTAPFMFYVLTKDLMEQAYDTLSSTLNEPIGRIGGGQWDIKKINVCTIQTAVMAVNLRNKKFKISDYQFDEEDIWDKKQIESEDKLEYLKDLLKFTKGIYMDETHHAGSRTVQDVITASPHAYWKYGGSATPYREDGAEIMIQALFGRKIVDINASYLIKKNYLVRPYIIFDPIEDNCNLNSYQSIYKKCVSGNDSLNTRVANMANYFMDNNLTVLILVQQYSQGDYIKKALLPYDVDFLTGKMKRDSRKKSLQDIRNGNKKCIIGTTLFDEGIDAPCLDVVIMAGGGSSATRVYQRIGRALRINGLKKCAVIIYFEHDAKYLCRHAKKAKKIIKEEPEFKIIKSNGGDFTLDEIDKVYGIAKKRKNIFDAMKN